MGHSRSRTQRVATPSRVGAMPAAAPPAPAPPPPATPHVAGGGPPSLVKRLNGYEVPVADWNGFLHAVEKRYGTRYGHVNEELAKALQIYARSMHGAVGAWA